MVAFLALFLVSTSLSKISDFNCLIFYKGIFAAEQVTFLVYFVYLCVCTIQEKQIQRTGYVFNSLQTVQVSFSCEGEVLSSK